MANTDILSNLEHFGQNISVRGADLWYGDFHAIRDISVDIPARQVTAFIGPGVPEKTASIWAACSSAAWVKANSSS